MINANKNSNNNRRKSLNRSLKEGEVITLIDIWLASSGLNQIKIIKCSNNLQNNEIT